MEGRKEVVRRVRRRNIQALLLLLAPSLTTLFTHNTTYMYGWGAVKELDIRIEGACCDEPNQRPEHCNSFTPSLSLIFNGPLEELKEIANNIDELIDLIKKEIRFMETEDIDAEGNVHYCWVSWVEVSLYEDGKLVSCARIYPDYPVWDKALKSYLISIINTVPPD